MKKTTFSLALASLVLIASPALAHNHGQEEKPMCEGMAEGKACEHKCCEKDADGKMSCKMKGDSKMDHSKMSEGGGHEEHQHAEADQD